MYRPRAIYTIIFLSCVALLGFALYLEHIIGLEPCPLCVFQRIAYMLIAMITLLCVIHNPKNLFAAIYPALIFIVSICGLAIAIRQTWLQHLPADKVPTCGPDLGYMIDAFPVLDMLRMVLSGSGECAEVQWEFLGLSIPEYSVIYFLLLSISSLLMIILHYKKQLVT